MKLITKGTFTVGSKKSPKVISAETRTTAKALGLEDSEVERYLALGLLIRDPEEVAAEEAAEAESNADVQAEAEAKATAEADAKAKAEADAKAKAEADAKANGGQGNS